MTYRNVIVWTMAEGDDLASYIDELVAPHGFNATLVGSVAMHGASQKDLDILLTTEAKPENDSQRFELAGRALGAVDAIRATGFRLAYDFDVGRSPMAASRLAFLDPAFRPIDVLFAPPGYDGPLHGDAFGNHFWAHLLRLAMEVRQRLREDTRKLADDARWTLRHGQRKSRLGPAGPRRHRAP